MYSAVYLSLGLDYTAFQQCEHWAFAKGATKARKATVIEDVNEKNEK
jgi:hypothetical protein